MAALNTTTPTTAGTTVNVNNATSSDTVTQTQLGTQGLNLVARTSGTAANVTVSDAGTTPASNPATLTAVALGATASKVIYISPSQVNLSSGLVTITCSTTTGLTYEVYPA